MKLLENLMNQKFKSKNSTQQPTRESKVQLNNNKYDGMI